MSQLIVLKFTQGNLEQGFPNAIAQLWQADSTTRNIVQSKQSQSFVRNLYQLRQSLKTTGTLEIEALNG
ncbi:hypothetical protein H6F67_22890 [Microcoleus sp. FACHB-1515]|uniref:hypothetical protein n=1 Tax=Cyanophyceae TaxID=3028117 RepID=UPI0016829939|nr:hypothetical protein [Microcoleus sp. FACHB-1515]MBD2092702.1 hypothetical protein [Microcoleus sp. FACHB-1515]